ncbi:MAG: hypothetical protein ACTHMM_09235 [Agriterribacter sp.]
MTNCICNPGFRIGMRQIGNILAGAFQGSVAEFTVVLKLNQGVPEIGRNRFRAAFCVTFFRKKVTKSRGFIAESKTAFVQTKIKFITN